MQYTIGNHHDSAPLALVAMREVVKMIASDLYYMDGRTARAKEVKAELKKAREVLQYLEIQQLDRQTKRNSQ